ncbi:DUF262 domain-containing protein [Pyxidicoccus xibeiensis]|uniref:DUF262 domain-containing protein n=1 Tax=Pyxidicoccus xibeiensis TaxID=2906759 RepID=UPI0020A7BD2F|nr:DUF262 domain-containing protein [Pyxidicoccus xibeiensis]MCP3136986.1 DUF262 domain-containing protein [Pyxidicoccus xibeiensis]
MPSTLTRRPQATAFSIEDLLDRVRRGEVRIPDFQRPLKWTAEDVRDLFDSVYRGYPIGTLLFWKREAPAASITFGPVRIDAPSTSQALWVVDGQQRITALAAVLLHGASAPAARDGFTLFFDLEAQEIVSSRGDGPPPAHWLPLNVVLDSEQLLEWLDRYPGREKKPEHTRTAIRVGKAAREYQIPAYVVEAAEEKTLRIIFKRLNTAGKPLTDNEVFNALYGGTAGSRPSNLKTLASSLAELGFGTLEEPILLRGVLAVRGLDFTQDFQKQLREEDDLGETLQQTEAALRNAIIFLRRDAGVLHEKLLPEPLYLILLARFFHLHPEPSRRTRDLLSRWLWRGSVDSSMGGKARSAKELLAVIGPDEEESLQAMLAQVSPFFDDWLARHSLTNMVGLTLHSRRMALNALLSLRPRHLLTAAPLEPTQLLEGQDLGLKAILTTPPEKSADADLNLDPKVLHSLLYIPANFLFHVPVPGRQVLDLLLPDAPPPPEVLESHAVTSEMLTALREARTVDFLMQRMQHIDALLVEFLRARTRHDESDRPSLKSLIVDDEEED